MRYEGPRTKILIVDDSEINRAILADMLCEKYEILEAENGVQAVELLQKCGTEISLLLLDIVMPRMDGFEVLAEMNRQHWIEEIPVIMISSENSHSVVERAYELGVTDFIGRPFDEVIVCRRVINTIMLYAKQKRLIGLVADQVYESEKSNALMISILSNIVEFRNGESGLHVLHIGMMTELLLRRLQEKTDRYDLDIGKILLISKAAAFHDIGKISIAEEILNKPGRLTPEEFEIMKTHSMIGAGMLEKLPNHQEEPLVALAYEICRWHHERYDGSGYPDGLKGEEIPISAQVVALADAYDALISERVYKKAFPHEKAVQMILDGECGAFHPLLLECLSDMADVIREEIKGDPQHHNHEMEIRNVTDRLLSHEELAASNRTLSLLEKERIKFQFFASMSQEMQFEYTASPSMLTMSEWGAQKLGIPPLIVNPLEDEQLFQVWDRGDLLYLDQVMRRTTPAEPVAEFESAFMVGKERRLNRIICRAMWSGDEKPEYLGAIGKIIDIHEEREELKRLKELASRDTLTGLLNHTYARKEIQCRLQESAKGEFAMIIFDLDYFKKANDERGHMFGDHVLQYMADRVRKNIRSQDIAARVGGDEFLIFLKYDTGIRKTVARIFGALSGEYDGFLVSVSMGIAGTADTGREYESLYVNADQALYEAKRMGRGCYCFYEDVEQHRHKPTAISPIDECGEGR